MRFILAILLSVCLYCNLATCQPQSGAELIRDMFENCLNDSPLKCINEKARLWIKSVAEEDTINITDDLSLIRTKATEQTDEQKPTERNLRLIEKFESFLASHALKIKSPKILQVEEYRSHIPSYLLKGGLSEGLTVPLSSDNSEGRGFVKKVMVPFLLGLKFKSTVLVPLALAMIALKTWKAMTLGLLSLVLSGALVIFKLFKPTHVNYEVLHYPHHLEHHHHHPHGHHHHAVPVEHAHHHALPLEHAHGHPAWA